MINRLQLRGISRKPSDRMTADGGCEESLNVHLDNNEIAPDVSPSYAVDTGSRSVVYLHKTNDYSNYIYTTHNGKADFVVGFLAGSPSGTAKTILTRDGADELQSITSIGNMLVMSFLDDMAYALFKDGEYTLLGHDIPFPDIKVRAVKSSVLPLVRTLTGADYPTNALVKGLNEEFWNGKSNVAGDVEGISHAGQIIRDARMAAEAYAKSQGKYMSPVMFRYSLVLYDGQTEILSDPYYITGTQHQKVFSGKMTSVMDESEPYLRLDMNFGNVFSLRVTDIDQEVMNVLKSNWSDLVTGIRFYLSEDIMPEGVDTDTGAYLSNRQVAGTTVTANFEVWQDAPSSAQIGKNSLFFEIKRESIESMLSMKTFDLPYMRNDERMLQNNPNYNTYNPRHIIRAKDVITYNSRLVATNFSTLYSTGPGSFPGVATELDGRSNVKVFVLKAYYYIKDGTDDIIVSSNLGQNSSGNFALSYFTYPSRNCYKVVLEVIHNSTKEWFSIPMSPHMMADEAYYYNPTYLVLDDLMGAARAGTIPGISYLGTTNPGIKVNNGTKVVSNAVMTSRTNNMFVWSQTIQFSSDVLGIAAAVQALSTGQFGQFPLYAFTKEGVWALGIEPGAASLKTDPGEIVSTTPVSRESCISKQSIVSLDQTVLFVSPKGVMQLSGSQMSNLSPDMVGGSFVVNYDLKGILSGSDAAPLESAYMDTTPFRTFVAQATPVYDYVGQRVLFFARGYSYAYVLMLASGTWHKTYTGDQFIGRINSYPDALVNFGVDDKRLWVNGYTGSYNLETEADRLLTDVSNAIDTATLSDITSLGGWIMDSTKEIDFLLGNYGFIPISLSEEYAGAIISALSDLGLEIGYRDHYKLKDYTTDPAYDGQEDIAGLVISRPFDLDNPDVLKSIRHIRIRGNYAPTDSNRKGRVRYVLMGSQDGIHFSRVTSLHGKAWKMYRLIIISKLKPNERISWVDVDFATRFTGRIR